MISLAAVIVIRRVEAQILRNILAQLHQLFLRRFALRLDFLLKALALFKLAEDHAVFLCTITAQRVHRFGFILRFDLGIAPCQAMPDARHALGQAGSAGKRFRLPAFFMGFRHLPALFLMTPDDFRLAEVDIGRAPLRIAFGLLDELPDLARHAGCNLRLHRIN